MKKKLYGTLSLSLLLSMHINAEMISPSAEFLGTAMPEETYSEYLNDEMFDYPNSSEVLPEIEEELTEEDIQESNRQAIYATTRQLLKGKKLLTPEDQTYIQELQEKIVNLRLELQKTVTQIHLLQDNTTIFANQSALEALLEELEAKIINLKTEIKSATATMLQIGKNRKNQYKSGVFSNLYLANKNISEE